MDFGSSFVSLGQYPFDARNPGLDAILRSDLIDEAISHLVSVGNGGTLYFPPGEYSIQRGFIVPENVVFMLAPGAILKPGTFPVDPSLGYNPTDIIVHGCIDASGVQFIEPPYVTPRDLDNPDDPAQRMRIGDPIPGRGRLILRTNRVAEVYPEWFGAQPMEVRTGPPPVDSYPAIQAALDAAYNDRWATDGFDPAPIPVCLHGSYTISRPLRLGVAPDGRPLGRSRPFVLRGHQGGYLDRATLSPTAELKTEDASDPSLKSMLRVEGATGYLIEDIQLSSLNRSTHAFSCLRIERIEPALLPRSLPAREASAVAETLVSLVRRCAFRSTDGCLVQLGQFRHPYSEEPHSLTGAQQDLGALVFEGCAFRAYFDAGFDADARARSRLMDAGPPLFYRDGIYFRATETRELRIDDSFFFGRARASIRAWGGRMTLSNMNFVTHRVRLPGPALAEAVARYGWVELSGAYSGGSSGTADARDNGCDIFLEYPGPGVASTAVHLRSAECQTWRHFASWPTSRHPKAEHAPGDVIEEDIRCIVFQWEDDKHTPFYPDEPAVLQRPAAILWDGPARRGSGYVAAGVQVRGVHPRNSTRTAAHPSVTEYLVIVGTPRGEVIDLGAREAFGGAGIRALRPERGDGVELSPLNARSHGYRWYRYLHPLPGRP